MLLTVKIGKKTEKLKLNRKEKILKILKKLGLNRENVVCKLNGKTVTEEEYVGTKDKLEIIIIVSGD